MPDSFLPMKTEVRVLLIEDDEDDVLLTKTYLSEIENTSYEVFWEFNPHRACERMLKENFNVFLIDYRLGSETGLDVMRFMHDNGVLTPAIILTGQGELKVDIDASNFGAADYLIKSELTATMLDRSIRYAISQSKIIQQLNEKEKKYRALFERSVDPVFLTTEDLQINDVNQAFLQLFDSSQQDDSFQLPALFVNQEDYLLLVDSLAAEQSVKDFEILLITHNQVNKSCLLNCVFVPNQHPIANSYQFSIQDLTNRKLAEREMLIAERLSITGEIARTLAHEIRNPLTNLNLALNQLRAEFPSDNLSVILYEDIIQRNALRIDVLIGEMLNASRPEHLELQLCSVVDMLKDTLLQANDRIELKKINVSVHYPDSVSRILVDRVKIEIALLNIILNALESMETNTGHLSISVWERDKLITISIADNGSGIKPEDLARLFDPFFTTKKTGIGLGLTSTKNILNSHSAKIEVLSKVNSGTTFYIIFRLAA
jgi:signal transduction histidine kinase